MTSDRSFVRRSAHRVAQSFNPIATGTAGLRSGWSVLSALLLATSFLMAAVPAHARPKVVAYVPNWIDLHTFADTIDYGKNHAHQYRFRRTPPTKLDDLSFDAKDDELIAKARRHQVKILMSIGGVSTAVDAKLKKRYFALLGDDKLPRLSRKFPLIDKHHHDGLKVDIERPCDQTRITVACRRRTWRKMLKNGTRCC